MRTRVFLSLTPYPKLIGAIWRNLLAISEIRRTSPYPCGYASALLISCWHRILRQLIPSQLRIWGLSLTVLCMCLHSASAVELGDTRDDIVTHYGQPHLGDDKKGIAIYTWDVWRMKIDYANGVATRIAYTKDDPLSLNDIQALLEQDGGVSAWKATESGIAHPKAWKRTDGATAKLDSSGYTLQFEGTQKFHAVPASSVSPAATPVNTPAASPIPMAVTASPAPQSSVIPAVSAEPSATPLAILPPDEPAPKLDATKPTPVPVRTPEKARASEPEPTTIKSGLPVILSVAAGVILAIAAVFLKVLKSTKRKSAVVDGAAIGAHGELSLPATIDTVSRSRFELVMAELYRRQAYDVQISCGVTVDGEISVNLYQDGFLTMVACRPNKEHIMSLDELRQFCEVLTAGNADRGIFVTTGLYSPEARAFAAGKPLELLSTGEVEALVRAVSDPDENIWEVDSWLGEFLAEVKVSEPECPICRNAMSLRQPNPGVPFWTCKTFPTCQGVRNARVEVLGVHLLACEG